MGDPPRPRPGTNWLEATEVVAFVQAELANDTSLEMRDLPGRVQERFGLRVHQRTIERALAEATKKPRTPAGGKDGMSAD